MNAPRGSHFGAWWWLLGVGVLAVLVIPWCLSCRTAPTSSGAGGIASGSNAHSHGAPGVGPVPASFFGLDVNGPVHWPSVPFGTLRMQSECSATGQHPCAFWYDTEPTDNTFVWSAFDEWMVALAAHPGTAALYAFTYTPPFAADPACLGWDRAQRDAGQSTRCVYPGSCCPPRQDSAGNMIEWQDYVSQVVRRAAGRITSYELWNEPNITSFWCADTAHGCDSPTNPQKLVKMAQIAYHTIHQLDPGAVVLTPSAVIDDKGPRCGHTIDWLAGYLAAGGGRWADAISFHGYLAGCPLDVTPEHVQGGIRAIRALLDRYGLASMPIWDTESSWGDAAVTDQAGRAAWLARAYLIRWSEGVQRFAFYGWDMEGAGELWNDRILPAGTAFGELYKWLVGATMTSPCTLLDGTLWSCPLMRSDGAYRAIVVWKSSMDTSTASYTAPNQYVRYQELTGAVGNVAGPMNVSRTPILFETGPIP
jgi:hypothetical protein